MNKFQEAAAAFNAAPRIGLVTKDQFDILDGKYVGQVFNTNQNLLAGKIEIKKTPWVNAIDKTSGATYIFQTGMIAVKMVEKSALALVESLKAGKLIDLLNCRFIAGKGTSGNPYLRLSFPGAGSEQLVELEGTEVVAGQEVIFTK